MASDKETAEARYYGLEIGQVIDVRDPEGLGRVRVKVPGILDEGSGWALPLGTGGGGGMRRGSFAVPPVHAEVGVFFHRGDPLGQVYYVAGHWGRPNGKREVPYPVEQAPKEDAPQIQAFETERWLITYDDRPDHAGLRIEDKRVPELKIELDGKTGTLNIGGMSAVNIQSAGNLNIDALGVTICGRKVVKNGKPIQ